MAKFEITGTDGARYEVNAPDGMDEREVLRSFQAQMSAPKKPTVPPPSDADISRGRMQAVTDTVAASPKYVFDAVRSAGRGALDLATGAGQLVSRLGGADYANRYDEAIKSLDQGYQEGRYSQGPDIGRFTGNVVGPGMLGSAKAAATLPQRMLQGAKTGGILGAATEVTPGNDSFWTSKAAQIGAGSVLGGASVPVAEGLARAGGAAVNAAGNLAKGVGNRMNGAANPATIEQTLKLEFERSGVDWGKVSQAIRSQMVDDVSSAVKSGGTLDAEAARRLADFQKLGMQPLRGQITRDPYQFAQEQNLSKMEAGKPIADRLTEQNQKMIGAVDSGADPYQAGKQAIAGLAGRDAPRRQAVTQAYDTARAAAGAEADVPLQPVAQRLGNVIEDFGAENIPSPVLSRLKEFGLMEGKQTRVFNLLEAEKLRKLISNNIDNPNSPAGAALTQLKASVQDSIDSLANSSTIGAEAAGAFQQARKTAAGRFQAIDRSPALENVLGQDTVAPEKFVEKFFIRGEIQDVANNLRNMAPESRSAVRQNVMEWIKERSVNGSGDAAKFSQSGLNKALKSIGDRKLELIFAGDPMTLDKIRTLARVGQAAQSAPVSSGVNYSNSATTLLDFMDKAANLPGIGFMLGKPSDILRATQSARAVGPVAPVTPGAPVIDPEMMGQLSRQAGILGAPAAVAGMGLLR